MLLPSSQKQRGCPLLPINDIRGVDGLRYSPPERALRCKMAALCRLLDMYGWAATAGQGQFTHATVRISQDQEHFLINPFGLLLHEVKILYCCVKRYWQANKQAKEIFDISLYEAAGNFSCQIFRCIKNGFLHHYDEFQVLLDLKLIEDLRLTS